MPFSNISRDAVASEALDSMSYMIWASLHAEGCIHPLDFLGLSAPLAEAVQGKVRVIGRGFLQTHQSQGYKWQPLRMIDLECW